MPKNLFSACAHCGLGAPRNSTKVSYQESELRPIGNEEDPIKKCGWVMYILAIQLDSPEE